MRFNTAAFSVAVLSSRVNAAPFALPIPKLNATALAQVYEVIDVAADD